MIGLGLGQEAGEGDFFSEAFLVFAGVDFFLLSLLVERVDAIFTTKVDSGRRYVYFMIEKLCWFIHSE